MDCLEHFIRTNNFINKFLNKTNVLIYSSLGTPVSSTVVLAFLMWKLKGTLEETL